MAVLGAAQRGQGPLQGLSGSLHPPHRPEGCSPCCDAGPGAPLPATCGPDPFSPAHLVPPHVQLHVLSPLPRPPPAAAAAVRSSRLPAAPAALAALHYGRDPARPRRGRGSGGGGGGGTGPAGRRRPGRRRRAEPPHLLAGRARLPGVRLSPSAPAELRAAGLPLQGLQAAGPGATAVSAPRARCHRPATASRGGSPRDKKYGGAATHMPRRGPQQKLKEARGAAGWSSQPQPRAGRAGPPGPAPPGSCSSPRYSTFTLGFQIFTELSTHIRGQVWADCAENIFTLPL